MRELWKDFSYALRQLRRSPGFALTSALTLSLTVGLAATVFSVFDALLVRPLPYGEPDRIVVPIPRSPSGYTQPASSPEYKFWRENNKSFSALAGFSAQTMNMRGPQGPSAIRAVHATDNFFAVFDVQPLLGRTFLPGEDTHGRNNIAVLSYALWQKSFGGKKEVLGSKIDLDGWPMTVIGVMPSGFRYPLNQSEVAYAPFRHLEENAGSHWMQTLARLKPDITPAQAEGDMTRVISAYTRVHPDSKGRRMQLIPIADYTLGQTGGLVKVLALATVAVLALGCVNIAGLMLVRGLRRERELALRAAVGASRMQLAKQLIAEIALLAVAGTAGGGIAAWVLLQAVDTLLQSSLQRGSDVALNLPVLLASLFAALLTLLIAGLLPARQLLTVSPAHALRSGSAGAGASRSQKRLGAVFIGTQMALAMLLLATSGLLLRTLAGLRGTNLGFRADRLLVEDVNLSPANIIGRDLMSTFYNPLLERVRAMPGVSSAAVINLLPVQDSGFNRDIQIAGYPPAPSNQERLAEMRYTTPEYFRTMGSRLVRGRLIDDKLDTRTSSAVIVVNQTFVKRFIKPGEDPIGKHLADESKAEIVGVVTDQRQNLFQPPLAEMDWPLSQLPSGQTDYIQEMQLVVRTSVDPLTLAEPLRKAMQQLDPTLPFRPVQTMEDVVGEALVFQRMESWLFGVFAALAVLLAAVGLYGLIAQQVEWGRRDIGVRMALGSTRAAVVGLVLEGVARVSLAGLLAGLALAWALRKVIGSILTTRAPHEVPFVLALAAGMELLAVLACAAPARRAASVDPVEVLRAE